MLAHRGRVQAVMLGVGAAFDFISGTKPRVPAWLQAAALEWLHRVASEPKRLWKRYSRDQYAVRHRRGSCCLRGGSFSGASSCGLQQEFDFDRLIGKLDRAGGGSLKHTGIEERRDITVNGFHVPAHAPCRLADRDRAHPAK
jgi:hypothetical protein